MPSYTYRPKSGDVVIFPNGIELNYLEDEEAVFVMAPESKALLAESPVHPHGLKAYFVTVKLRVAS
jgi:hypothetical protein